MSSERNWQHIVIPEKSTSDNTAQSEDLPGSAVRPLGKGWDHEASFSHIHKTPGAIMVDSLRRLFRPDEDESGEQSNVTDITLPTNPDVCFSDLTLEERARLGVEAIPPNYALGRWIRAMGQVGLDTTAQQLFTSNPDLRDVIAAAHDAERRATL